MAKPLIFHHFPSIGDPVRQWLYQHLDSGASLPPLGRWAVPVGGPNPSPQLQATAAKAQLGRGNESISGWWFGT